MELNSDALPLQGQVQVHFFTNSQDIELPEEKRQLLVPTQVRRYGLSQILNSESMLDTPSPIPFDFLINGAFLRTSLVEYLTTHGLSSETTLTLQYVRSLIPPLFEASFEHDDTVTCVDVLSANSPAGAVQKNFAFPAGQERILSGSYDDLLRVWNKSGQILATSSATNGQPSGIKCAKFISPTHIAAGSRDRTVRVWEYTESEDHFSGKLKPMLELCGHEHTINSIAVHTPSSRILSASQDGAIGLWSTKKSEGTAVPERLLNGSSGDQPANKRRKTSSSNIPQRGALSLMPIHGTHQATGVIFHPDDPTVAYSTSTDHTLRTIDLTTSLVVDTRTTLHPLLCLTALPSPSSSTSHIIAAGTSARHITLFDPRATASTTSIMTLRGHTNFVTSLAGDPDSSWGLVSAAADGTCRVWDLRNTRSGTRDEGGGSVGESVYVIEREEWKRTGNKRPVGGEGIQVWSVAWDRDVGIVSGGEDKKVQINRGKGVTKVE